MTRPRRSASAVLLAAVLLAAACGSDPVEPTTASAVPSASNPVTSPAPSEQPFRASAWPEAGSACDLPGYHGLLGRIEAPDARTVRFTLCRPDGAFLARIAHPALGILDTATVGALAADASLATALPGTGPYRIDRWEAGSDVILQSAADATSQAGVGGTPTVVLRWATDSAQRLFDLQSETVDGIDAPGPLEIDRIETQPEVALVPRPGLATVYLGFGSGGTFASAAARRALAGGIDRKRLADASFPAGTLVPTRLTPCLVPDGCGGKAWYGFNGPAAAAALKAAGLKASTNVKLHVPDRAIAGLADPVGVAKSLQAQLKANLGLKTTLDAMPVAAYSKALANGTLDGLYLGAINATLADPSAFLDPLFGSGGSTRQRRYSAGIGSLLAQARTSADPAARSAAYAAANDAVRDAVPVIPLVHPGSSVAFRSDVSGVVVSPQGADALGSFTPGDRRQIVFMQSSEPRGAYCGDQASADALRLCALVTEPLYREPSGGLTPEPALAQACTPSPDAIVWTCILRSGVRYHDGASFDAGDVLTSYVAQWDRTQPLHVARPDAPFAVWQRLFGDFIVGTPTGG